MSSSFIFNNNITCRGPDVAEVDESCSFLRAPGSIRYLQSPGMQHQLEEKHMAEPVMFDKHQLHEISKLEETINYSGTSANPTNNTMPLRNFTTSNVDSNSSQILPNALLLTSNFKTQQRSLLQQKGQQCDSVPQNLGAVNCTDRNHMHQPHVYNVGNDMNKNMVNNEILQLQQLSAMQQQQIYQQQEILQHHPHMSTQQHVLPIQPVHAPSQYTHLHFPQHRVLQQFFSSVSDVDSSDSNTKHRSTNPTTSNIVSMPNASRASSRLPKNSTVLMDRINICINDHYNDLDAVASPTPSSTSITPQQQVSPIIPAILHKPMMDSANSLLIESYIGNKSIITALDEPDSTTTTTNTPPRSPENALSIMAMITEAPPTALSPNTTTVKNSFGGYHGIHNTVDICKYTKFSELNNLENNCEYLQHQTAIEGVQKNANKKMYVSQLHTSLNHPTRSALRPTIKTTFALGEDVLIKRSDDRFYLGTVIDMSNQQFLVCFDDKSEVWSTADKIRKLGTGSTNKKGQMCVACKLLENADIVEICERCGRGYHRSCTDETASGSGNWMCKRCAKPMKILKTNICVDRTAKLCCQAPCDVESQKSNEKQRANDRDFLCYCGKIDNFDDNRLQCCRCKNFYHTSCIRCFKSNTLRGDGFFVFCCSVCNNGHEFLRRIQMKWVDLTHLTLYNLSATKKYQKQKYHHLVKDIWPFALRNKIRMPISKTWIEMPDEEFKEKIKITLNSNTERFISGKEIKKDPLYYALRSNGPPLLPKIDIRPDDILSESLIVNSLHLKLLKGASENANVNRMNSIEYPLSKVSTKQIEPTHENCINDVYEFRIDDEDEKFTSDDEIPIKHIMEEARKHKTAQISNSNVYRHEPVKTNLGEKVDIDDLNDDFCNASIMNPRDTFYKHIHDESLHKIQVKDVATAHSTKKPVGIILNEPMHTSRKRKAFTVSKSYKETVAEAETRISDSSSDENSSSSRGTSLDLIIPPPKDFLGPNNPFLMITPKKDTIGIGDKKTANFSRRGSIVKNSILTTTSLDFSSKLAALKSSGTFSNTNLSDLAKAAGQPRLMRTIKRRLSAKDIIIGPNQEMRRRRIRRLSSNIEVISQTTRNPITSNFIPIYAKDSISTITTAASNKLSCLIYNDSATVNNNNNNTISSTNSSSSSSSVEPVSISAGCTGHIQSSASGRRLRQRPEKCFTNSSRRSSISGGSTSPNSSMLSEGTTSRTCPVVQDLKQSVTKYFGAVNRFESGEKFAIRATRKLANGQMQYLIEWGENTITERPHN